MRRAAPLLTWVLLAGACASRPSGNLNQLTQRVEEMAQGQAADKKRIEELNNRVFILEDRVDTSRVNMESSGTPPRLPVIRLRPTAEADQGQEDEGARSEDARSEDAAQPEDDERPQRPVRSMVEESQVKYSGAARAGGGSRPVLRLYGNSPRPGGDVAAPLPGSDPSTVQDKLAVVPLPSRRAARKVVSASVQPMRDYQSALHMYQDGKVSAAADAFGTFIKRYTRHDYSDNALYWLGECFYDLKNYRLALKMFRRVVEEYPTGNKAPDALLKMGFSYLRLQEKHNAKTVLEQLVESFPKSQVARLASETLVKIQTNQSRPGGRT